MFTDNDGTVWIGTREGGLIRFHDGKFTNFTTNNGLSGANVICISQDQTGDLWIGTDSGGLNRLHDGKLTAFTTKDGSEIRELLAHRNSAIRVQSLAEARLPPGAKTTAHFHRRTEEIYYILEGCALMRIGQQSRAVRAGDAIAIPPGEEHQITNTGTDVLKFLCCCAPGYEHDDTVLVE